jgi:hypothetical protein
MGAWGTGPFDNDDAMDFFGEVEDCDGDKVVTRLREALSATSGRPGYLEVSEANVAIAAASLVAAGRSRLARAGHPAVDDWLASRRPETTPGDQELALRALDRVCGPSSEWLDLWQEAGEADSVRTRLSELRAVLSA